MQPFRIVGYATDWHISPDPAQYDELTHINYAFLLPRPDGSTTGIANPWRLKEVVERAHARGVKALISVGGWGADSDFEAMAANAEARAALVHNLEQFAVEYKLDGIDIDWEYPDPGTDSALNYLELMRELYAISRPQGWLLTSAVVAEGDTGEGISAEVFELVDFLNIMAYDGPGTNHSPYEYAEAALDYWSDRGLPAGQTVLGVPFYSRPTDVPYRKLVDVNPEALNVDDIEYYGTVEHYNGMPTIQRKTALARQRASGIMIWALAHDTNDSTSLLGAIFDAAHAPAQP